MIRPICRMGHPVLRQTAKDVTKDYLVTDDFRQLLGDLHDSMEHYGGIGIAAPQIGVSLKVAIIELKEFNRYGEKVNLPLTTFINPRFELVSDEQQGFWEGCLSVPGLRGFVERPRHIKVHYMNEHWEDKTLEAQGFLATVLQHELDHLFGVLYIDRIKDPKLLTYQEEFEEFIQGQSVDEN
jgi:peptide deformylase